MQILRFFPIALVLYTTPSVCQISPPTAPIANFVESQAPTPIAAPTTTNAILRTGTEVALKLAEELTTKGKKLHIGQRFRLETSEAIVVQGVVVIPNGTPAIGEVSEVTNKGMWGKSGHFTGQLRYLTVNGRQIRVSGTFDDKGVAGGVGAVAVSAIVFAPAGFFMTGTSAKLPIGTAVKGFIDEDVALSIAAQAPAPMQVSAPAEALVVAAAPAAPLAAPAPVAPVAAPAVMNPVAASSH